MSTRSWTSSRRTPDVPFASAFARSSDRRPHDLVRERLADAAGVAAQRGSAGARRPAPASMWTSTSRPKPVFTPYVGRSSCTTRSISAREASIWRSASGASATGAPRSATPSTSSTVRSCPVSWIAVTCAAKATGLPRPNSPAAATSSMRSGASSGQVQGRARRRGGHGRRHQADELAADHGRAVLGGQPLDLARRPGEAASRRCRSGSSRPARGRCARAEGRAPARPEGRRRAPAPPRRPRGPRRRLPCRARG